MGRRMGFIHRISTRRRGIARASACLLLIVSVAAGVDVSLAQARGEELVQTAGLALLAQLGASAADAPQAVSINAQRLFLASTVTPLPVAEVLARFERLCGSDGAALNGALAQLPPALSAALPSELGDPERWLSRRRATPSGSAGQLACFARSRGGGVRDLLGRLRDFALSGELARLGAAHYVIARRDERTGYSHVLVMWAAGSLNVRAMFPEHGDAPGQDSALVPRPERATRRLSARLGGTDYGLRVYETERAGASVIAEYERALPARGFVRAVAEPARADGAVATLARAFVKDGHAALVVAAPRAGGKTDVILLELGVAARARSEEELG